MSYHDITDHNLYDSGTGMPSKGEHNREMIVDAANRLFYEHGYNTTSFKDIADSTGIPKGNFYFYFKSKDELLKAVIEDRLDRLRDTVAGWEKEFKTPLQRLLRCVEMPMQDWPGIIRYGCPMGSLSTELGKQQPEMKRLSAGMFKILVDWVEKQFLELGRTDDAHMLSMRFIGRLQGSSVLASAFEDKTCMTDEMDDIRRWVTGLSPDS
ncbi:MAG: TetR/AcrR family transcriptional regulator [Alphaproteobacteria bacterium]